MCGYQSVCWKQTLWVDGGKDDKENDRGVGGLQSRLKGSSYQELAEEGKIEGGVVDCDIKAHVSGHLVLTWGCCFGRTLRGEDYL